MKLSSDKFEFFWHLFSTYLIRSDRCRYDVNLRPRLMSRKNKIGFRTNRFFYVTSGLRTTAIKSYQIQPFPLVGVSDVGWTRSVALVGWRVVVEERA